MIFKNITKKKICILHGGQKIIVNPGEFIEGEKSVFECYRGLIKIINPKITPRLIRPLGTEENRINQKITIPFEDKSSIVIDSIVVEDVNKPLRDYNDIQVDFIIVEDISN